MKIKRDLGHLEGHWLVGAYEMYLRRQRHQQWRDNDGMVERF